MNERLSPLSKSTSGKNKEKHNGYTVEEVSGLWSKVKYYSLRKQV